MADTQPKRKGTFIQVVQAEEFDYQYTDPETGVVYDSVFRLRLVPDDVQESFKKRHTRTSWRKGQRVEEVNWAAFANDALDHAIVAWTDLRGVRFKKDGTPEHFDLPCTRDNKLMLPEKIKGEIVRLCVGKEAGEVVQQEGEEGNA